MPLHEPPHALLPTYLACRDEISLSLFALAENLEEIPLSLFLNVETLTLMVSYGCGGCPKRKPLIEPMIKIMLLTIFL